MSQPADVSATAVAGTGGPDPVAGSPVPMSVRRADADRQGPVPADATRRARPDVLVAQPTD